MTAGLNLCNPRDSRTDCTQAKLWARPGREGEGLVQQPHDTGHKTQNIGHRTQDRLYTGQSGPGKGEGVVQVTRIT